MLYGSSAGAEYLVKALTVIAGLFLSMTVAQAWDETKYPNFGGQWKRPPGFTLARTDSNPSAGFFR